MCQFRPQPKSEALIIAFQKLVRKALAYAPSCRPPKVSG
jgi:hypothetical protein